MKSIKVLLTLFLIFSLITSCSKDDSKEEIIEEENTEIPVEEEDEEEEEEEETAPTAPNSLKSLIVNYQDDIFTFYFHYFNNKIDKLAYVNEMNEITYYSFAYNDSDKIGQTIKYDMNPNNTSVDFSDSSNFGNITNTVTHEYYGSGLIREVDSYIYYYKSGGLTSTIMPPGFPVTNISYDTNDKIERTNTYSHVHDPGISRFFEFDSHNNPFYYLFDEFGLVIDKGLYLKNTSLRIIINDLFCISPYNVLEKKEYDENQWPSYNVDYTYNNENYPLEGIFIFKNLDTQEEFIRYTISFDYY
jgi:hypothetical protein